MSDDDEIVTIERMWDILKNNPDILPVRISTLAPMMGMSEDECCAAFIEHATPERGPVTFRYPPLP